MQEYINDVTSDVTRTSKTSATKDLFNVTTEMVVSQELQEKTRSTVAKLLFIATHARPDVLIVTNFLCGRAEKYTSEDLGKLERILQYLKGCPSDGITLRERTTSQSPPTRSIIRDACGRLLSLGTARGFCHELLLVHLHYDR
jgi:hypothetical protein